MVQGVPNLMVEGIGTYQIKGWYMMNEYINHY